MDTQTKTHSQQEYPDLVFSTALPRILKCSWCRNQLGQSSTKHMYFYSAT